MCIDYRDKEAVVRYVMILMMMMIMMMMNKCTLRGISPKTARTRIQKESRTALVTNSQYSAVLH